MTQSVNSPKDFALACKDLKPNEIYNLFEFEITQKLRDEIYNLSDPKCLEPFRDACIKLGTEYKIESLINY